MPPALLVGRRNPNRRSVVGMVRVEGDRVHHLRARPPGGLDAQADLDGLDRLDAHDGAGQPGIELAVPLGVASQADRAAGHDRLDDAAQRVAGLPGRVDRGDDRAIGLGVQACRPGLRRESQGRTTAASAAIPPSSRT